MRIKRKTELLLYGIIGMNILGYLGVMVNKKNFNYQMNLSDYKTFGTYKTFDYKVITSMFVHENYKHLLINMFILIAVYLVIKKYFNPTSIIMTYFVSGITSNLVYIGFNQGTTVGASGGIFGLLGLIIALSMKNILLSRANKKKQILLFALITFGIISGAFGVNTNVLGHVTGLSCGVLLGIVLVMTGKVNL